MAIRRPHLLGEAMRRILFATLTLIIACFSCPAWAFTSVYCSVGPAPTPSSPVCVSQWGSTPQEADRNAFQSCSNLKIGPCSNVSFPPLDHQCLSVGTGADKPLITGRGRDLFEAQMNMGESCKPAGTTCTIIFEQCDADAPTISQVFRGRLLALIEATDYVTKGLFFGVGVVLVILVYAMRGNIINFLIHDNLPLELPVYGEDIQCLFKRTQRINWYGRVVFGIVVNLAMTHQQLIDIRKYWLGRVIAFDSLRRQRQNELARMHLQLAASVKSEAKDKKPLSPFLAALKTILLVVFYLIRALFSFLFSFLFIRVTIAHMVRGAIIESNDLVLILQAKDAIEQSTTYLKEYLTTADTFDGGDEIYEPK